MQSPGEQTHTDIKEHRVQCGHSGRWSSPGCQRQQSNGAGRGAEERKGASPPAQCLQSSGLMDSTQLTKNTENVACLGICKEFSSVQALSCF